MFLYNLKFWSGFFKFAIVLSMLVNTSSCRFKTDRDNGQNNPDPTPTPSPNPPPPGERLFLGEDESNFSKSKYCPSTRPPEADNPTPPHFFDISLLNEKLASETGLNGWIHGAVHPYRQYLFTYRKEDPEDFMAFFKAEQMSMIGATKEIWDTFKSLNRHDKVRLKGKVFENGSSIRHLLISSIEVTKKYANPPENSYSFDPSVFKGKESATIFGQVHALVDSPDHGLAVVVERNQYIFPIAVDKAHEDVAKTLFKGDIVNIDFLIKAAEGRQPHFVTDSKVEKAITIVDPLVNCHGVQRSVEGHLVKFLKSPAISTDVYAVRVVDGNGIARNMTFFPGVDPNSEAFGTIFMAVSAKAKQAWDSASEKEGVVRNYFEKKTIKVIAKGKINVVSTEQANAQVYLNSADDVEFKVEP
ncbi:MAG: hypothetical protein NT027_04985 [Proteobacteria bacterium]|nr:hypothetical protein [Pseudomonadota bacterium]